MTARSSILAWRTPWTSEPGDLQAMGQQRLRHNREAECAGRGTGGRFISFHTKARFTKLLQVTDEKEKEREKRFCRSGVLNIKDPTACQRKSCKYYNRPHQVMQLILS